MAAAAELTSALILLWRARMQTCTDRRETKPHDGFLRIKSCRARYFGQRRVCRNRRARERYHSNAEARAAEIARSLRNKRRRAAERRAA